MASSSSWKAWQRDGSGANVAAYLDVNSFQNRTFAKSWALQTPLLSQQFTQAFIHATIATITNLKLWPASCLPKSLTVAFGGPLPFSVIRWLVSLAKPTAAGVFGPSSKHPV